MFLAYYLHFGCILVGSRTNNNKLLLLSKTKSFNNIIQKTPL